MMRWVSPLLFVGTQADADKLDFAFFEGDPVRVARLIEQRVGCVVPTKEDAAEVLRHLGAGEDWIESHVMNEWKGEPVLDS
jgi:hypothetical protein